MFDSDALVELLQRKADALRVLAAIDAEVVAVLEHVPTPWPAGLLADLGVGGPVPADVRGALLRIRRVEMRCDRAKTEAALLATTIEIERLDEGPTS